jgi:hypothetical protein
MIAKPEALLVGTVVLAFIAVTLIADLLTPGGFNVGQTIGGLYSQKTSPSSRKTLDLDRCTCEYRSEYEDYMCNSYCGDMSDVFCSSTADCLA